MKVKKIIGHKVQTCVGTKWSDATLVTDKDMAMSKGRELYFAGAEKVRVMQMFGGGMWKVIWSRHEPYQGPTYKDVL